MISVWLTRVIHRTAAGKYEFEVRVLSIAYLGVEASVTLPLEVVAK